jgi:hypothetical protein
VDQPLLVLLLPQRLERFHLEQPVRELLRADGVVAVDPSRAPLARMVPTVAARAAMGQARRMRLPGTPRAIAVFDPAQLFLAGALLARNPHAELWYGRPAAEEHAAELDAAMAERAALTLTPEELLAVAPLRMAELGISSRPSGSAG